MPAKADIDRFNLSAEFCPAVLGESSLPCIDIADMQVYVYADSRGALRVSIHLDGDPPKWILDAAGNVKIRVVLGGETVFDSAQE